MLYRGVDEFTDRKNGGRLVPKGTAVEVTPVFDGKWAFDGKFNFGASQNNTARAHQIDSGLYGGCGVSTTRSEEKAVFFATYNNSRDGYVYVIDEDLLRDASIDCYEFQDPEYPDEEEVTLIENAGGPLPDSIIVEKYALHANGTRKRK
jgi:hypothetical protein